MKKSLLIILTLLCSCQKSQSHTASLVSKKGHLKDKIVIAPMIDSCPGNSNWNVAEELTNYLVADVAKEDTYYVLPLKDEVQFSANKNPFSKQIQWLEDSFPHTKFVAFTELLKYEISEDMDSGLGQSLDISCRIRVFEKTSHGFKTILQEIVQESYLVPLVYSQSLNIQPNYKSIGYELSPLGVAHTNFSEEIAKRICEYLKDHP